MERLMQYVWQHRLLVQTDMHTTDGERIVIIDPGRLNTASGPDFFNAKVQIGSRVWAGDVEIHVRATDWHRHGHDADPAYDSVVLHVVDTDDGRISRRNGEMIPQMVMRCRSDFHRSYAALTERADRDLPCHEWIKAMPQLHMTAWMTSLAYERVYYKADRIMELLSEYAGNWEEVGYITLARALGFGLNAEPMERLARALPMHFLRKHADDVTALEGLLLGQAGLLQQSPDIHDPYLITLRREHQFYQAKFSLLPLQPLGWKMSGIRPQSFPYRRIAYLAALIHDDSRFASTLLSLGGIAEAIAFFQRPVEGFWARHYTFGRTLDTPLSGLSRTAAIGMVINVVVPLIMAHGMATGRDERLTQAMEMLQALPSERNVIIDLFTRAGVGCRDAFTSQALIHLRRMYCEPRRCLFCRVGHRMLAATARRRDA